MDNGLFRRVNRYVRGWLGRYHLPLVVLLSLFHVVMAYSQVRDSGGADPLPVESSTLSGYRAGLQEPQLASAAPDGCQRRPAQRR